MHPPESLKRKGGPRDLGTSSEDMLGSLALSLGRHGATNEILPSGDVQKKGKEPRVRYQGTAALEL